MLARTCGMTRVSAMLASHLGEKENNLRQRLREWCWDKKDKQGKKRIDWEVSQSFAPLLKWIMSHWANEDRRLVLAMDATTLKLRFVVLSISVVYRGCAIPVAWAILPANQPAVANALAKLIQGFKGAISADWLVLVMADRRLICALALRSHSKIVAGILFCASIWVANTGHRNSNFLAYVSIASFSRSSLGGSGNLFRQSFRRRFFAGLLG